MWLDFVKAFDLVHIARCGRRRGEWVPEAILAFLLGIYRDVVRVVAERGAAEGAGGVDSGCLCGRGEA